MRNKIKLRLIDVVEQLPSIKRIALSVRTMDNPTIMNVELFKKSKEYKFYKFQWIKYIAPEIDYDADKNNGIPYLLVQMEHCI